MDRRSRVYFTGLRKDDRRYIRVLGKRLFQRVDAQPVLVVCRKVNDLIVPEPEQPDGAPRGTVSLLAGQNPNGRCAEKSALFHIPSVPGENGMPRGC